MDLFEDLPEPSQSSATLKDATDFFSDIPDATLASPSTRTDGKGEKRKMQPEQENGSRELVEKKVCKGAEGIFQLKSYVTERQGEREDMQDSHTILNDITEECQPLPATVTRLSYFAVFDGHGGCRASRFAAQNLHQNIIKKLPKGEAVLCRYNEESQKPTALMLSREHNPTQYEERMRIQKAGGNVRDGRVLGVLEVSRSFGDGQYKRCGVICTPDIKRCQLTHNDRFILLACDGLFKAFTPEEAVTFIVSCVEDEKVQTGEVKLSTDARYEAACNRLANEAVRRGSADNITVLVVHIEH
uniref:Integrin-linked kinase-associated serine/threonine phosphatase 2C isoform X3 n=1 Tax=Geotrypetes seraphini TaxID=260995 RepID=A0A6P8S6P3_GEOSA|nr:integrin-linked kinase-associated serine/threonine phosphatase 2C isoform X3 [Geotrypetes seraphini]